MSAACATHPSGPNDNNVNIFHSHFYYFEYFRSKGAPTAEADPLPDPTKIIAGGRGNVH